VASRPATARGITGGALPGVVGGGLEYDVQRALGRLPWCVVIRNPIAHATLKSGAECLTGLGGKGAPDVHVEVLNPLGQWVVCWMECKAGAGALNKEQREWHRRAQNRKRHAHVVRSVAHALEIVSEIHAGRVPPYEVELADREVAGE
jgi:hypothetical protein